MLADNVGFRNVLISMRPKAVAPDLLSAYNVKVNLNNQFLKHIKMLKEEIKLVLFILFI